MKRYCIFGHSQNPKQPRTLWLERLLFNDKSEDFTHAAWISFCSDNTIFASKTAHYELPVDWFDESYEWKKSFQIDGFKGKKYE